MDVGRNLAQSGRAQQVGDVQSAIGQGFRKRKGNYFYNVSILKIRLQYPISGVEVLVRHRGAGGGGHPLRLPDVARRVQEAAPHQGLVPRSDLEPGKKVHL